MLIKVATFETTDPTVDSQTVEAQASGADALYVVGIPKLMAQVFRKADGLGWHPLRFITYTGAPVAATPTLAGLADLQGHHQPQQSEGPARPAMGQRRRDEVLCRLDEQGLPQARHQERLHLLGLVAGEVAGRHPAALQRRFQPRERDERRSRICTISIRPAGCRASCSTPRRPTIRNFRRCGTWSSTARAGCCCPPTRRCNDDNGSRRIMPSCVGPRSGSWPSRFLLSRGGGSSWTADGSRARPMAARTRPTTRR